MKSQPLRRSALAMLMGMALLTAGCAADTATDPDATGIPSTSATTSTSPDPSSTAEPAPSTPTPAPTPTTGSSAGPAPGDDECGAADAGAAASGTFDDPYAVGDEIAVGCFTVVVTDVTLDATDTVQDYNAVTPASGHVFSVVMLMIARTGGDSADVSDVEVRLASSRTASVAADPDLRLEEQAPPTGSLSPGQATGGTLVFEAPDAGTPRVLLRFASGGEVWVAP